MSTICKGGQITTQKGVAFLNIIGPDDGYIGVWGNCFGQPTILRRSRNYLELLCFDSEEIFQGWLEVHTPLEDETILRLDKSE